MPTSTTAILNANAGTLAHNATALYISNVGLLEFFSVIISIALFAGIVAIIIKTGWFTRRRDIFKDVILKSDLSKDHAKKDWAKVQAHFYKGDENDLKIAILEADKLLEEALRHAGIRGVNLGERLKNIKSGQIANIDNLWQAHKLRNQIAHEPAFKLKRDLAENALTIYEDTLKSFHLLD